MVYDVIVIGSGMGGLAVASRLSEVGYKVCIFEKHFIPGGYATNFKRKGYNFDVSLHGIGGLDDGGSIKRIFEACGIANKITPIKNKEAYYILDKDELIPVPNNKDEYKKFLVNRFSNEKKGILELFKAIDSFEKGFKKFVLDNESGFLRKLNKDIFKFISWSEKTTYDVIQKYVKDEEFLRLFTPLWMYYGLPPKELSALYFFIPWISYHSYGKYYIKGGAQALSDSFVNVIKKNGGDVKLNSEIERVIYSKNKVHGVILKNGQEYRANRIISNANPISTYKMLPSQALKEKEINKILNYKIGCTLSQLYIGLDCNPSELNIPNDEVFILGKGSHEDNYNLSLKNEYKKASFLLTNYNGMDDSLNDYSKGVLTITYLDNYDYWPENRENYKKLKEQVIEKIIEALEIHYPGVREHIIVRELGTPRTMERYTGNPKGAVYGYGQYIKQAGRYRLKSVTSIKNLSFVGAWINPGGGYEGAISGGIMEAQRIIKEDKK